MKTKDLIRLLSVLPPDSTVYTVSTGVEDLVEEVAIRTTKDPRKMKVVLCDAAELDHRDLVMDQHGK